MRTACYVARTYAYVAAGDEGIVIVDAERPEHCASTAIQRGRTARRQPRRDRRDDECIAVRLCRRRRGRPQGAAADVARIAAEVLRVQPEPKPQLIASYATQQAGACACRRVWIATAASTKPADRSPCSAGAARDRSTSRKCGACISTANGKPWTVDRQAPNRHHDDARVVIAIVALAALRDRGRRKCRSTTIASRRRELRDRRLPRQADAAERQERLR